MKQGQFDILDKALRKASKQSWKDLVKVSNSQSHLLFNKIIGKYNLSVECFLDNPSVTGDRVIRMIAALSGGSCISMFIPKCKDILLQKEKHKPT